MSKKDNKRYVVRQTRRVLNDNEEFVMNVSGKRLYSPRYGGGLHKNDIKVKEQEENNPQI